MEQLDYNLLFRWFVGLSMDERVWDATVYSKNPRLPGRRRCGGALPSGGATRHAGYAASQRLRKRIEEGFGWIKTTGGLAKTRHRGLDRVGWMFTLTGAAYNLVRLPKLVAEAPA